MADSSTYSACEEGGKSSKYYSETNSNAYMRAKKDLQDAKDKVSSSHVYAHQQMVHPNRQDFNNMFRFDVIGRHQTSFIGQLAEATVMKNSQSVVLNLKDEYTRCIIPDITLGDRGWQIGGPQRPTSRLAGEPRLRIRGSDDPDLTEDTLKVTRRPKVPVIVFTRKRQKRKKSSQSDRVVYKSVKQSSSHRMSSEEFWKDLVEKSNNIDIKEEKIMWKKEVRKRKSV